MTPHVLAFGLALAFASAAPIIAADSQPPAFPGAQGPGRQATGGRGGSVVHVTNLNARGPGSLADAVSQGDRIVVFDVSGYIDLTESKNGALKGGRIDVRQPNITITGQTAPGEGICIKGGTLTISADNVIVRHLRSRRGWIAESDTGDALEVKPLSLGEASEAAGQTDEAFLKRQEKKAERGKFVHEFAPLSRIIIDHCSTSWATDENLTVTHADQTTVSWCIAAEGCDYPNPKQTPPNHSEGSLWGSGAPDGRATLHHTLYAHNRLRNPRTTGGDDVPAVLTFFNNIVYDWSEHASHTGSERVLLNWVNNYYKPGPSTPAEIRSHMFEFHGDPGARLFARGNWIDGDPAATRDNKLAVFHGSKFRRVPEAEREAMKVDAPFGEWPVEGATETAEAAYHRVLAEAGATLPSRDSVDLRIVNAVRDGGGKVIDKETDLPERDRWPDYRQLPPPADTDRDGMPDFWEQQFGLEPKDGADSAAIGAAGYSNIEHYLNNTHPGGDIDAPIVWVSATTSRACADTNQRGEWKFERSGTKVDQPLEVRFTLSGDAEAGIDYAPLAGSVIIPAGQRSTILALNPLPSARADRTVVLTLQTPANGASTFHPGCPSASLIVIRK